MTVSPNSTPSQASQRFKTCSEAGLERIKAEGSLVGHALSSHSIIPNVAVLSGKARLLGQHNGQLNTLAMLGPGNSGLLPCFVLRAAKK